MDEKAAKKLIKNVLEKPFDKDSFIKLINNIFNHIEPKTFIYQKAYIPEKFRDYIKSLERIGQYTDGINEIDILIVKLEKDISLERARTMQRNFIASYLNGSRGGKLKDAALVAFVSPNEDDWRFSFVKMEYEFDENGKIKEKLTPAKRYSYLVGKNEKSHTAQSNLIHPLLKEERISLEDLENAFAIDPVTDRFYNEYRNLFIKIKEELDRVVKTNPLIKEEFEKKSINSVDFSKKLLGQIVFLYFLQKKGWFGVKRDAEWGSGSKHFIRELFEKKHSNYENFFNDILEPLFYKALSVDRSSNGDYYARFNCKIPFLNGGLFDPIGNYDWIHIDINLPNELFSNEEKTKDGDIGTGILDVLDRYNFTVKEDAPLEKEVAIDPEMLGRVYEKLNAITLKNFDEFVKAIKRGKKEENRFNKENGVYYTPREIVHFMCKQSLINYLLSLAKENSINLKKEELENLIDVGELILEHESIAVKKEEKIKKRIQKSTDYKSLVSDNIRENAKEIDKWLSNITICDPAVGSGAFPVGMMHEIVMAREVLNNYIKSNRTTYDFKRECIEKSLYGVDIDSGAIEITKLRLWLSLVVDEDDINNIKPLPNLGYKIVCGNSLLSIKKDLFNSHLFSELEELKTKYFNETNAIKKQKNKKEIDELIKQLTNGHLEFDFKIYFSEVFHKKGGFDIVIANPPYIQLQKNGGKLGKLYKDEGFETFSRTGDIYVLFYEKAIKILKENGILTFITSNKWMRAGYGEKLRKFFLRYNPILLIDLGPDVFESATVDTNIFIIQKANNQHRLKALKYYDKKIPLEISLKEEGIILKNLTKDAWFIGSKEEIALKEKIEKVGKPLKDWDIKIYYGIKTGFNEAFIITTEKRNEILANCKDEEEKKRTEAIIKPILRGRDIKRYYYEWDDLWVIVIPSGWTNANRGSEKAKIFIEKTFPSLMNHLKHFEAKAKIRNDKGDYWWELRKCAYYLEFEKEKIMWQELAQGAQFAYDENGAFFVLNTAYILTGININLKYILGYLNSRLNIFSYDRWYCTKLGQSGTRWLNQHVKKIPIPPITPQNKHIVSQIEKLVDKILTAKKSNLEAKTSHWEKEIDQLVYKLYGLTEDEIRVVEKSG